MKHMTEAKKQQFLLAIFFSVVIFAVELFTILFTAGLSLLLVHLGVIPERTSIIPNNLILLMSLFSIVIGAGSCIFNGEIPASSGNKAGRRDESAGVRGFQRPTPL